jgi:hypothetical protein
MPPKTLRRVASGIVGLSFARAPMSGQMQNRVGISEMIAGVADRGQRGKTA